MEQGEEESGERSATEELRINHAGWRGAGTACVGVRMGGAGAVLRALVDTGSPVSLMLYSAFVGRGANVKLAKMGSYMILRGVNGSVIAVRGRFVDQITFENGDNKEFNIELFVVEDQTMEFDILLGRRFFDDAGLRLSYGKLFCRSSVRR